MMLYHPTSDEVDRLKAQALLGKVMVGILYGPRRKHGVLVYPNGRVDWVRVCRGNEYTPWDALGTKKNPVRQVKWPGGPVVFVRSVADPHASST